jgi:ferredoxin
VSCTTEQCLLVLHELHAPSCVACFEIENCDTLWCKPKLKWLCDVRCTVLIGLDPFFVDLAIVQCSLSLFRCYGCGRCIDVCPPGIIDAVTYVRTPADILPLLDLVEAIEASVCLVSTYTHILL